MTLVLALAVGALFGIGAYLLLQPDLIRVVIGVVVVANAANVALLAAGRATRGEPPILPTEGEASDPLVQAMTVTAVVIGFGVAALLFSIVYRVYRSHDTVDLDELARSEVSREEQAEHDDREEGRT